MLVWNVTQFYWVLELGHPPAAYYSVFHFLFLLPQWFLSGSVPLTTVEYWVQLDLLSSGRSGFRVAGCARWSPTSFCKELGSCVPGAPGPVPLSSLYAVGPWVQWAPLLPWEGKDEWTWGLFPIQLLNLRSVSSAAIDSPGMRVCGVQVGVSRSTAIEFEVCFQYSYWLPRDASVWSASRCVSQCENSRLRWMGAWKNE